MGLTEKKTFQKKYKHYLITVKTLQLQGSIQINVQNKEEYEAWKRVIDIQFVVSQGFQSAQQMYDYIVNNSSKICFEDGNFKMENRFIGKKHVTIDINIIKQETDIDQSTILKQKIVEMKKNIIQKQRTIKLLSCIIFIFIAYILFSSSCIFSQINEKVSLVFNQATWNDNCTFQIQNQSHYAQLVKKIGSHPQNYYRDLFPIKATSANSAKIFRIGSSGQYSFINKFSISHSSGQTRYKIKFEKLNFFVGFVTDKGLGVTNNYLYTESVYFEVQQNGRLQMQGVQKQLLSVVKEGETIDVVANLVTGKIYWLRGTEKLAECDLPVSMKNKDIYLSITLNNPNDEVEVFA